MLGRQGPQRGLPWAGFAALAGLGMADALLLWWGSGATVAQQLWAVLGGAAAGCVALLWLAAQPRFEQVPLAWVLGLALLLRVVAAQASPLLEDDHYRYLWDGFRTATSFDPYRLAPSAFFGASHLSPQWQDILGGINNPDIPTLYGPVLQGLFALAHVLAPGRVGALQALLVAVDLACLGLLVHQRVGKRWLLAYALHPLILKEAVASAHPDGLVGLWLLLALWAWQRHGAARMGVLMALAVATKVAALVVLPLFLVGRGWRAAATTAAAFAAGLSAIYLPFILSGGTDQAGLLAFGTQWRFNPLLYRAVEVLLTPASARAAAAVLIVLGIAALAWWQQRNMGTRPHADQALLWLLLLAPVVNPWYWLWALAPAALAARLPVMAVAAVSCASYVNTTVLREAGWLAAGGPFNVSWYLTALQLLVLATALYFNAASTGADAPPKTLA